MPGRQESFRNFKNTRQIQQANGLLIYPFNVGVHLDNTDS